MRKASHKRSQNGSGEKPQASCYFWKWADNDLSGKPTEVHADLLRGVQHPALQTFDARPVLTVIEQLANGSPAADRDEWTWSVAPANQVQRAQFIFLTCPRSIDFKAMHRVLARQLLPLGVSCFDEGMGMLGDWFPPKLNEFQWGAWPGENIYDITPDDLPVLIKRIPAQSPSRFAILTNRRTHFVQCMLKGRRYVVEWRENHDVRDFTKFDHWKAQDQKRMAAFTVPYTPRGIPRDKDPDFLTFADTVKIFRAFLLQQPRPAHYHWRNINAELP
ncbi:MAG: hypothetical protein WCS94_02480 [Verrucomicrobiota bacterium]